MQTGRSGKACATVDEGFSRGRPGPVAPEGLPAIGGVSSVAVGGSSAFGMDRIGGLYTQRWLASWVCGALKGGDPSTFGVP